MTEKLAQSQLRLFRRAVRGRLRDSMLVEDDQIDELWSVGQHHGLLTPLIDWTHSPFVALFFAFVEDDAKHERDNPFRAIYVLNKTFVESDEDDPDIRVFEPRRDDHGRLVSQAGLFTLAPPGNTIENHLIEALAKSSPEGVNLDDPQSLAQYICKVYVANEDRVACLRHLRKMNVHHASLFPDLLGASAYCNSLIEDDWIRGRMPAPRISPTSAPESAVPEVLPAATEQGRGVAAEEIVRLLAASPEAAQVEPPRLELIARDLADELRAFEAVDWFKREPELARMRNQARVILRRLGYPAPARDEAIERLLLLVQGREGNA